VDKLSVGLLTGTLLYHANVRQNVV